MLFGGGVVVLSKCLLDGNACVLIKTKSNVQVLQYDSLVYISYPNDNTHT